MTDDRLALGIFTLIRRAISGDVNSAAVVSELVRLYQAAGEPLLWQLREFAPAPTEYVQTGHNEIIREDTP